MTQSLRSTAVVMTWRHSNVSTTNEDVCLPVTSLNDNDQMTIIDVWTSCSGRGSCKESLWQCNIRLLHRCEVRIENSVPMVTVWHHEALPFNFQWFIFKVAFITIHNDVDGGHFEIWRHCDFTMTSTWRQSYVTSYTTNAHRISRENFPFFLSYPCVR